MASKEQHLAIVRSVLAQGLNPAQTAARYRVCRQWGHTLLGRHRAEGPDERAQR